MTRGIKWIFDRLFALLLLFVLSPILIGISLWILIDDGRPVLFVQKRAGKRGKPFRMLKFRTMVVNAVEVGKDLDLGGDPFGLLTNDPRITASGRFLRRTSLDELPQIWNVLIGQMSLVGPRPDLVEQAANYSESDRRRLEVLPGITGYSQIQGRDEIGWPERIRQDIEYIENWSFAGDCKILMQTFGQFSRDEPTPITDEMNIERNTGDTP